jgi:putative hydrolase of the HAD superfamily
MAFDVVLLDLYDTIAWSEWFRLRERIAARTGLDEGRLIAAFDATRPARGVGAYPDAAGDMAAVLEAAGLAPDPRLVADLVELERSELTERVHLYDDVLPVLSALRDRGARTALISNCSHSTRPIVHRLHLEDVFDAVVLSFEARAMKPDPAIYRAALDTLGVDPRGAVFVDDQPRYCDGAAALGIETRLILRPNEDAPSDTRGHRVVTDLRWLG